MIPLFWHCANGHILGYITTDANLAVYRLAQDDPQACQSEPVFGHIIGNAVVECSICGAERRWHFADKTDRKAIEKRKA